ncbi:Zinc carboxypeptidase [Sphingopyxis sp. LC81]|uniref:M14 family metallopeptidase n=1 Tax=Sphingopyxis sp. LC81 TaxID=1502850 RepID=UPI00050E1F70|nr:M14 metallopeptidase family protein [Sphingopyxis sp. LC81]KGB55972.1 Zinc carboxypeptidase [Sphingopyxis sp. LC81]
MKKLAAVTAFAWLITTSAAIAGPVPTPKEVLGHDMGEDRYVASYSETAIYWKRLAEVSDRIKLVDIGPTVEKRRQLMAIVSSPENLALLDKYKDISERLGRAEGLTDEQARALAAEGKAVIWVDGGIHASETLTHSAIIQQVYDLVNSDDAEAKRIRDNVIILFVANNPDGQELVANWYMRIKDPAKREAGFESLPKLYHAYVGHDNNRDFYMAEMPETQNITRVLFRDWRPQVVLNQHQTGPAGTVVFIPPFRDPFNFNFDPLVMTSLEEVGAAMQSRLLAEGKRGGTSRDGAHYDTWYNGNLRSISYFHNAIGILTETIGKPVPIDIELVPERQLPGNNQPAPIAPQKWHIGQSLEYSMTINRAVLSYAAANREKLLFNIYRMGANSIARGSEDSWTMTPTRVAEMHTASAATGAKPVATRTRGSSSIEPRFYEAVMRNPANRDARAYVIDPGQRDYPTAVRFLNALIKLGVDVDRASAPFSANGRKYPAGTYFVRTAQAYRPHILDMFEPQDYPENFEYPGGPPIPPADATGYTPAIQMGIGFDRVLDPLDVSSERVSTLLSNSPGRIVGEGKAGYLVGHGANNSFILSNRLLKVGQPVSWLSQPVSVAGSVAEPGALWVPASPAATRIVESAASELGLDVERVSAAPAGERTSMRRPRVALVDVYGGLMPTGWMRWIFDQHEFPFTIVYPQQLDAGKLRKDFDVVILPHAAFQLQTARASGDGMFRGRGDDKQPKPEDIPAEYRGWLGTVSAEKTIPALRAFVDAGGSLIAMGGSAQAVAQAMGLPVEDAVAEAVDGKSARPPRSKFYVPGALVEASVDPASPLTYGLSGKVDLFFDDSPVWKLKPGAAGVQVPVRFAGVPKLRSGWAHGLERLDGAAAIVEVDRGKGRIVLFGPEVALRAQTHGAFKLLFNAIYLGADHGRR